MSTFLQRLFAGTYKRKNHRWARALKLRPQLKGSVTRATILTPRKPNSARRSIAKVILSTDKKITSYIPGVGHNLRRYSTVLIRGGGARDLPGVSYSCIRGVYDFMGLKHKTKRRSIYGAKWPENKYKVVRRKDRVIHDRLSLKKIKQSLLKDE